MRNSKFFTLLLACTFVCFTVGDAQAIRLKIKQSGDDRNKIVAGSEAKAGFTDKKRGVVKFSGRRAQLAIISETGPQPLVLAYKKGRRLLSARKVLGDPERYCSENDIQAYTVLKGSRLNVKVRTRAEGDVAFYSGRLKRAGGLKKRNLKGLVAVNSDCLPSGNGLTLGLGTADEESKITPLAEMPENAMDQDADGLLDFFDVDIDDNGVLNNYDSDSALPENFQKFRIFSNLKVGLEDTVNVNAFGRDLTNEEVDALVSGTTLAIEVKAGSEEESELNCGGLEYCSAGGTGTTGNPAAAFPGTPGGDFDFDSDGNGTITAGGTGDFQLVTNASAFNALNAGDSFVQTVTPATGRVKQFFASLQFAFRATPALKSLTLDPDGVATTTNFSYPATNGSAGTPANCISVSPNGDDEVVLEYVAWRPQRAGISALGESSFVDLGNSLITIDIPNAPAPSNSSPANGVGNCPAVSYSTSDTNLTVGSDGLVDTLGDVDTDVTNTVTFRINITECLASSALTLDSGEQLGIDLQFRNVVGDNAAQKICIKRP